MNKSDSEPISAAGTATGQAKQPAHSDLQYVSLQLDGKTVGGWYRALPDGQMQLLALANVHCERRFENTPFEQARAMLADFVRQTKPRSASPAPDAAAAQACEMNACPDGVRRHDAGTLGALLYADPAKVRVTEKDWLGLVHSIAAGNRSALRALFDCMHRVVFTLLLRLTHHRDTAEELTLNVFEEVWRHASEYDAECGSVVGWIMTLARSRAEQSTSEQRGVHAKFHMDQVEARSRLSNALTTLTRDERQVIEAAFFSEWACAEVGARFHQPIGTVRKNLHSGLMKLRQALAPQMIEQ